MAYTALGQSIYLLTGPLIGRIYTPSEFGLYGLFYAFAVAVVGLVFLNYDFAIPAASTDRDAWRLTRGSVAITLVLSPFAGLVMGAMMLSDVAGFGALTPSAPLLLTGLLLAQSCVQLMQSWNIRRQQTLEIGKASVTLNAVRGAVQVGLGAILPNWIALVLGEILGRIANGIHLFRYSRLKIRRGLFRRITHRDNYNVLRRYREFPLVLLPSQTIDGIVALIQSAGIAFLFGPAGLGLFFMMRRSLDMPVAFVFRSLSDLFYARLAQDARERPEQVRPFFVRSVVIIAIAGSIAGVPLMMISPQLFAFVFGEQWREAGTLAAIMAPAAIINLAVAPVARIFALTTRPQLRYWFTGINLVGTVIALGAAYLWEANLVHATVLISTVTVAAYLGYLVAGYIASAHLRTGASLR